MAATSSSAQVNLSLGSQTTTIGPNLDMQIIDETYGKHADLYDDVLRVPTTASHDEIQVAYFDRRSELFTMLAKLDASQTSGKGAKRQTAERKMDSVVFAVRILSDPKLRKAYDAIRGERMGAAGYSRYTLQESPSSSTRNRRPGGSKKPGTVTPTESPDLAGSSSSLSETKNWISSTFSSGLFSSLSGSKAEDDDDNDDVEAEDDGDDQPKRKPRSWKKMSSQDTTDPVEKKSLWGLKKRKKKAQSKNHRSLNDSIDTNVTDTSMTDHEEIASPRRRNNRNVEVSTVEDDDTRLDDDTRTFDGDTLATASAFSKEEDDDGKAWFDCMSGSRALNRISDEISGACEDTLVSVDQVFNAFTLTDKDIKAVTKKIHKAQRQLDK